MSRVGLEAAAVQSLVAKKGWRVHRSREGIRKAFNEIVLRDWEPEHGACENCAPCQNGDGEACLYPISPTEYAHSIFRDYFPRNIVPDGWAIIPTPDRSFFTILAIEVEDSHKLSEEKLKRYGHMWWGLDGRDDLALQVLSVDRYGRNEHWFNMKVVGYWSLFTEEDQQDQFNGLFSGFGPLTFSSQLEAIEALA